MFHRRRNSDRANNAPPVTLAPGRQSPNDNAHHDDDHHHHQHPSSSPLPPAIPSNMRGMRRLEMRRGMEESHYLAQQKKTRTSTLNPPIDLRLVDYVSDYDSNLMCPICRCPFIDPVVLYDCHHCFCRECLQQTWTDYHPGGPRGNCPTCRANTRLKGKDGVSKIIVNMCDELLVNCPKQDEGCTARIKRGELVDHLNLYCQYSLVQCPRFPECEQPIRRKDRANCTHWGVACIDCQQVMFVDNLEVHSSFFFLYSLFPLPFLFSPLLPFFPSLLPPPSSPLLNLPPSNTGVANVQTARSTAPFATKPSITGPLISTPKPLALQSLPLAPVDSTAVLSGQNEESSTLTPDPASLPNSPPSSMHKPPKSRSSKKPKTCPLGSLPSWRVSLRI